MLNTHQEIIEMVCTIPSGKVATYGLIARLVNRPRNARQVGYALAALSDDHEVPWHRVVNSKGEIKTQSKFAYQHHQRVLLEDEGVEFTIKGRVDLKLYLWNV